MKNAFTFYPPIFGFGVENFDGLLIMGMREERSNADLQKIVPGLVGNLTGENIA